MRMVVVEVGSGEETIRERASEEKRETRDVARQRREKRAITKPPVEECGRGAVRA